LARHGSRIRSSAPSRGRLSDVTSFNLKITFLGTGTSHGVPMIGWDFATCHSTDPKDRRQRTSVLIATDEDVRLLVDAGPDLRPPALPHDIRRLDAILS